MAIKTGGDEPPDLIKNHWTGEDDTANQGKF
jgi:hypothetical protein